MLLLLMPDSWINRLLQNRREQLSNITIYYEPGCNFCQRVSLLLREFLLSPTSSVACASTDPEAQRLLVENNSWVVRGVNGQFYLKWHAMDCLLERNLLLRPIAWFFEQPFMRTPTEKLYDAIGTNRQRLARVAKILFPFRSPAPVPRSALIICGFLMVLAFFSNVFSLARLSFPALGRFEYVTAPLQVRQNWDVFAPSPVHYRRDYRFNVDMADGSSVDLMRLLPKPVFRSDANLRIVFASPRWAKYFTRFDDFAEDTWAAFGRYLCRQAQAGMPSAAVPQQVEITLVTEPIEGTQAVMKPAVYRAFDCTVGLN
jgi:hypothetical protein